MDLYQQRVLRLKRLALLPAVVQSSPDAMSTADTHDLPAEIWVHILNSKQGLSRSDFKKMSSVCKLFRSICQPEVFEVLKALTIIPKRGYGPDRRFTWKHHAATIIRSKRRIAMIGNDPSLCAMPKHWLLLGGEGSVVKSIRPNLADPSDKAPRSLFPMLDAISRLSSGQTETLAHHLRQFFNLTKLSLSAVCLTEDLMRAMSSHPALNELVMDMECTLPANPPLLANLNSLDYGIGRNQRASEGILRAIMPSTQILRASLLIPSRDTLQWIFETMKHTPFTRMTHLCLKLQFHADITLLNHTLSLAPLLQTLIVDEEPYFEKDQADIFPRLLPSETGIHIRSVTCSVAKAKAIVPGRPVEEIRLDTNEWKCPPSLRLTTCSDLSQYFGLLSWSTASITVLCLPDQLLAPLRLLSFFVAESFPVLRELKMMVSSHWWHPRLYSTHSQAQVTTCGVQLLHLRDDSLTPESCSKELVEQMLIEVEDRVETELMAPGILDEETTAFEWSSEPLTLNVTGQGVSPSPDTIQAAVSSIFNQLLSSGKITQEPKGYKEALVYIARGYIHLPSTLEKLVLLPACSTSLDTVFLHTVCDELSARYSSLGYVNFTPKRVTTASVSGHFERVDGRGPALPEWTFIPRPSLYE